MTIALLVLAIGVVAVLLFASGGSSYRIVLTLENASQLVDGNQVKVGGVPVGSVSSIDLAPDGRAQVELTIDDSSVAPLHAGTRAEVRSTSLAGVANRYVALTPGPVNAAKLASGAAIPAADATAEVDLDQLLNTLDPATLRDLQQLTRNGASAFSGRAQQFGAALTALDPALSQADQLEREVLHDQGTFARFLVESGTVVSAVASRQASVTNLVASGHAALDALATRDAALDSTLHGLPPALRSANTTLVNLRTTLHDVDPTVKLARPVAPPLAAFLTKLDPVARDARPLVARLRQAIDHPGNADLLGVLRGFPPLARSAVPAFGSAVSTVNDLLPIAKELRPYTPDAVGGLMNGFGGATSGYYDANGHYTRISLQSSAYSFTNLGSLLPVPPATPGLTGYQHGVSARCPGAATQPAPDRSNPYVVPGCDPSQGTP